MRPTDTSRSPFVTCREEPFQLYITRERIHRRLDLIGQAIDEEYGEEQPILVGVLNGAFMVLADLLRSITIPCEVDFLKLSSYRGDKVSSGEVTQLKRIDADLSGRHVIIVEDIVDTGLTMQYLTDRIEEYDPVSVRKFSLLVKPGAVEHDVSLDYVGFTIPDRFVIGYGLDFGQVGRNLPDLYIRVPKKGSSVPEAREPRVQVDLNESTPV
jgi:hypoxanthine phosphoribosyltransferase